MERNPPKADVCLVMECGYPYVTGGVSVWVDQLTRGLPDVTFAVAHLCEQEEQLRPAAYQPAPNVTEIVELPIEPGREHFPSELADRLPDASIYHACITGFASDAASIAAERRNAPLVVTEHGLAWREAGWIHGCNPGWGGGGGGQQGGSQGN